MLPNLLIIGAQKSASTFVRGCLAEHPEIYIPTDEIPYFESPDYEQQTLTDLAKFYQGHHEKILGLKRPNYLGKPEVPARVEKHLPKAKLIAVLRNPVERAVSSYYHYMRGGFIPIRNIEVGMNLLLEGAYEQTYERAVEIIEFGFYYRNLLRYKNFFYRKQLMILLHEDIIRDKLKEIQNIYDFLNVDSSYVPNSIDSKPQAVVYSIPRIQFLSLQNPIRFQYNSDRTRVTVKESNIISKVVTKTIRLFDKTVLAKVFGSQKPVLSTELSERVHKVYQEDIEKLEGFLDKDLSGWKAK